MEFDHVVVMTTTETEHEARELATKVVEARLGACAQCSAVSSSFVWHGEVSHASETLLSIKTRSSLFGALRDFIVEHHSYETPEVIAVPVVDGSREYLSWVDDNTRTS